MNLIANEISIVYPMSSISGFINYVEYTTGTAKGTVAAGSMIANPWQIGNVTDYTGAAVTEVFTSAAGSAAAITPAWTPIVKGAFTYNNTAYDFKYFVGDTFSSWSYGNFDTDGTIPASIQTAGSKITVAHLYNNEIVPQEKLPTLKAEIKSMPLLAKKRGIAVYYSNIAAFQAKQDYGFDLGEQLAEKAAAQVAFEIDTEVVNLLDTTAGTAAVSWDKTLPVGVDKISHYAGFAEAIEIAKSIMYKQTKRFAPNYMIVAGNVLPVITFIPGFKAANVGNVSGPYVAGTLNGVKIIVSPELADGRFLLGVNGSDMMSSAIVYAPYMPIMKTQLLEFADGGMSQGFSTLYDLKVLNSNLVMAGEITGTTDGVLVLKNEVQS